MKFQIILGIAFCAALALCGCSEMPMRMPGKESTETPLKTVSIPQHMPEATKQSSEYSPKNEPVPGKCVPRTTVEPPYIKAPEMPKRKISGVLSHSLHLEPLRIRKMIRLYSDIIFGVSHTLKNCRTVVHYQTRIARLSCVTVPEPANPPYITAPQAPTLTSDNSPDQENTTSMPTAQPAELKPMLTPNGLQLLIFAPTATLKPAPIPEPESTSAPTIEGGYAICSCGAVIKPDALVQHMKQHARDGDSHSYTAY